VFARAVVSLSLLWAYAVMVGLAPPVTRAAVMLTIGLIGPVLLRKSASINTVAMSAFVMLALDPALISDAAFQLSFVAVAAIAGLALPINELLRTIGTWRPAPGSPHPPSCPRLVKRFAEVLFWDYRKAGMQFDESPIRYHPDKAEAARWLCKWRLQTPVRAVTLLLITSAAIQLSTLPLMAIYFNRVSPVGVALNVISGSLTFVIAIGAFVAMGLEAITRGLATPFIVLVNSAHFILANSIVPFDQMSWSTFRVAHYQGAGAAIYLLYFAPLVATARALSYWQPVDQGASGDKPRRDGRSRATTIVGSPTPFSIPATTLVFSLFAALALVLWPLTSSPAQSGSLTVHFLDVGQGDAALIEFPRGSTMLVDAGGELQFGRNYRAEWLPAAPGTDLDDEAAFGDSAFHVGEAVVSRFLWSQGRTFVDYAVATHAHADHMGGLPYVERNFQVGQALVGRVAGSEREFNLFRSASRLTGTPIGVIEAGQQFDIEEVKVQVLWPPPPDVYRNNSINNDSVVLRLVFGSVAILMAGDIEGEAEERLIRSGYEISADVLKVPHHGSRTSSTENFLDRVKPRCAVISVGARSRFGHPHREVVDRYQRRGIRVLQTGRDGTVTLSTDGRTLEVRTFASGSG
jgi:competence protein ComEC